VSAARRGPVGPTPVESTRHADRRVNIPTGELADFVADAEKEPGAALYPRDPSLDPQLVWKGKDEQDLAEYLRVSTVPVYIQEKVDPRALVENLRDTAGGGSAEPELTLFDDFDGLDFDQLVDFYAHEGNWSNRLILGDGLLVMNSLAEKENLRGKVQMIYVDPPYGIRFGSNWQVSTRKREVSDGKDVDVTRQPEQIKAFRDTWERGIHSYLSYLRDRLTVGRELLSESGSCFVQIGDENVHRVRAVMDEVFGDSNFVSHITFATTTTTTGRNLPGTTNFLLWYAKDLDRMKYRQVFRTKSVGAEGAEAYTQVELLDGSRRRMTPEERSSPAGLPAGARPFRLDNLTSPRVRAARTGYYEVDFEGRRFLPAKGEWKTNQEGMARLLAARRIGAAGNTLSYVRFVDDFPAFPMTNSWDDTTVAGFGDPKLYVVQTNRKIVERCMFMTTDPGDLVLDPTCGSGTTAYVAEQWGRRWITIDTSRVALALARTRLMCARFPYYVLADSPDGAAKEDELTGRPPAESTYAADVRKGFVHKRVPHVTLKSIAQNPDIREGMTREEIDTAIARHADSELLVDQPYEDRRKVRVTGRFTVESLSPHRVLDEDRPPPSETQAAAAADVAAPSFEQTILDNLRKAGVHNTFKGEEIRFDRLDLYAGAWIQAEGEFKDAEGEARRVAISLGPEHGTVGPDHIKEAAKEAMRGAGIDLLVVCGFAFDPHSGETAREFAPSGDGFEVAVEERRLGRLRVLLARMNPDLAMGGDLLKKTGTGNLFMVFGEPDLDIRRAGSEIEVEVRGVDVYDPTTGEVRSGSTDDIACWFIDSNYNGESFFVRHAYFTGGNDPYAQLRRALRADVDENAWTSLYSTVSRPFPVPETGKIAVKVINHYGDEVLQVYDVGAL
jgi:adenine-specific DNA-methyltransferase